MLKRLLSLIFPDAGTKDPFARRRLKLRFEVNQAEAYRLGVDCSEPVVTLSLNPRTIPPRYRALLAARLVGPDICEAVLRADGSRGPAVVWQAKTYGARRTRPLLCRLVVNLPTVQALWAALDEDEQRVSEQWEFRLRSTAAAREFSHYADALNRPEVHLA